MGALDFSTLRVAGHERGGRVAYACWGGRRRRVSLQSFGFVHHRLGHHH